MARPNTTGTLFLVATPIGNLADISLRALAVLRSVDIIACEDTRHTRKLLNHFEIKKKLVSCHEHNENERAEEIVAMLREGRSVAMVSDAGTPGISDPGFRLVEKSIEAGVSVVAIPGPAAFVVSVVASGLPTDSIFFGGFLPSRKGDRRKRLAETSEIPATLVFYESPHRLAGSVLDCLEILGDRRAAVCREMTKLHEEVIRGRLAELAQMFGSEGVRGEIVLVIDRNSDGAAYESKIPLVERVAELIAGGMDRRVALKLAAKAAGLSRSEAYRLMQAEKE